VVNSQLEFLRNQKLGLNKEQVMVVELSEEASAGYAGLKNDLRGLSGIQHVAAATIPLYTGGHSMFFTKTPGTQEDVAINVITIDESFPETIGFDWAQRPMEKLKEGMLVINESAIDKLKLDKDPIGTKLALGNSDSEITGVVADFNYTSLEHKIEGLVMSVTSDTAKLMAAYGASIYIRLDPASNVADKIASIKTVFAKYQPGTPFGFYFLDDAFNKLYQSEDRLASLFEVFTVIGICIAALGLFGLVTFAIERRIKEIGIRKVLGASSFQIVRLFSGEFVWLFLISLAIAAPVSWWAMDQWLTKFSYRISLSYWMIGCAGFITLSIACITIAIKTWRTAQANPVDSLKNE
jgi:putative ABC transport system permease protein